jgi:hypothetical protein
VISSILAIIAGALKLIDFLRSLMPTATDKIEDHKNDIAKEREEFQKDGRPKW